MRQVDPRQVEIVRSLPVGERLYLVSEQPDGIYYVPAVVVNQDVKSDEMSLQLHWNRATAERPSDAGLVRFLYNEQHEAVGIELIMEQ